MIEPAFVLVHGGAHGAWCWEPLVPLLPGRVLAVDLPPKAIRGVKSPAVPPADLATVGLDDFARSVVEDIDAAGLDRFVLVGHSMGGLTIGEVARRIPHRIGHLVFVSCIIPPEGGSLIDTLPQELQELTRAAVANALAGDLAAAPTAGLDEVTLRHMFCNDMDDEQALFVLARTGTEAPRVFADTVTRVGIPADLPKTYVRLSRDQALAPVDQDRQIAHLQSSPGGDVRVLELDAGHDVMISAPDLLAAVLDDAARAPS